MIIAFTYFVGIGIAVITKQIRLNDFIIVGVVFVISVVVLSTCFILFFNAMFHLKNIPEVVKTL